MSDQDLQGDEEDLYREYAGRLIRFMQATMPNLTREQIEDACATTWIQFMRYQPERDQVWAWLKVVAQRSGFRLLRTEQRHPHDSLDAIATGDEDDGDGFDALIEGSASAPDVILEARDLMAQVATLPEREREVFTRNLMGLKFDEIAADLGLSVKQVRKAITKARNTIKQQRASE